MFKRKQYISLCFLIVFIFIKTIGLHALSHSEDEIDFNDCDLCEIVVNSNDTPFNINNQVLDIKPILINNYNKQPLFYYSYLFTRKQVDNALFCRPPPTT